MTAARIDPTRLHPAALAPPPSKSDAQRALVLAHVLGAADAVPLWGELPEDVRRLRAGLSALRGAGAEPVDLDCGDGGAPLRLLVTQAALSPGVHARLWGTARLAERPHGALLEALARSVGPFGFRFQQGTPWPLELWGADPTGEPCFRVEASRSSQYPSSLLLGAAALARRQGRAWRVELEGALASAGYLTLTVDWMKRCGFSVVQQDGGFTVRAGPPPGAFPAVPGDWSSLGYLLPLAWASGGTALGVDEGAAHPDRAILRVLREAGLTVTSTPGGHRVTGTPRAGVSASGEESPDLLPTVAALACVCPQPSLLAHVDILRAKESDRLEGILALTEAFGARTERVDGGLQIHPPRSPPALLRIESRGDHRMAMAGAMLATIARIPAEISDPECVTKSFPGFWTQLSAIGVLGCPGQPPAGSPRPPEPQ